MIMEKKEKKKKKSQETIYFFHLPSNYLGSLEYIYQYSNYIVISIFQM
jgi:hypothetical protein